MRSIAAELAEAYEFDIVTMMAVADKVSIDSQVTPITDGHVESYKFRDGSYLEFERTDHSTDYIVVEPLE